MTHPDLVLTTSWFWLVVFVAHGLHAAWLSGTMSSTWNICHCLPYHELYEFPWLFLPCFGKASFGLLMLLWCCLWIMVWGLSYFPWCYFCKNVLQLPWCIFDLLSQVLLWGYVGATYVLWVPHEENASLHHPYGIGTWLSGSCCGPWLHARPGHVCDLQNAGPWSWPRILRILSKLFMCTAIVHRCTVV